MHTYIQTYIHTYVHIVSETLDTGKDFKSIYWFLGSRGLSLSLSSHPMGNYTNVAHHLGS